MTNLLEAYKQLNKLYESKADKEAFINKFGKNYFDLFNKFKGKLQSKNISTDIVGHTKHTSIDEMKEILDNFNNNIVTDDNGKSKLNRKKIFEDENFIIGQILDGETAMNMGEGTSWCITGRYQTTTPKPSQAEHYFNEYLDTTYDAYYFVIKKSNQEKGCICKRPNRTLDIGNKDDKTVDKIEGLPSIKDIGYVEDICLLVAQQFFQTDNVIYHENDDVYSANGDNRICSVVSLYSEADNPGYRSLGLDELRNSIMNDGLNSEIVVNTFRLAHSIKGGEIPGMSNDGGIESVLNSYFYVEFTTCELFNICTSLVNDENYENDKVSPGLRQVILSLGDDVLFTTHGNSGYARNYRNRATAETFDEKYLYGKFYEYVCHLFRDEGYNYGQVFSTCVVDSVKVRAALMKYISEFLAADKVCMYEIENHIQGVMGQGQVAYRDPNTRKIYIAYEV